MIGTLKMAAPKQHHIIRIDFSTKEATMAKGQNRSSREQETQSREAKPAATSIHF
jgi:hypothetical protein